MNKIDIFDDEELRTLKRVEPQEKSIASFFDLIHGMSISFLAERINAIAEENPQAKIIIESHDPAGLDLKSNLVATYTKTIEHTVEQAPELSKDNRDEISCGVPCGCYFCFRLFGGHDIEEWEDDGKTALCPHCGVDAVIANVDDALYLVDAGMRWFTGET